MLVLGRKTGQRIRIGDDVTITVARVHSGKVRLTIEAPPNVRIVRGELDSDRRDDRKKAA